MFGKSRELNGTVSEDGPTIDGFFGDETAAAEAVQINELRSRVSQAEAQINSQFTSLATYAQIAQEQIELARAEARASIDRSEHRLTELIGRERADRISAMGPGGGQAGSRADADTRIDELEHDLAQMKATLDACFAQQKALAEAFSRAFEHRLPEAMPAPMPPPAAPGAPFGAPLPVPAPLVDAPLMTEDADRLSGDDQHASGPIPELSLSIDIDPS